MAKILIAEDERDIRELLTITLGRMGLKVDTASDVADARRRLAETRSPGRRQQRRDGRTCR